MIDMIIHLFSIVIGALVALGVMFPMLIVAAFLRAVLADFSDIQALPRPVLALLRVVFILFPEFALLIWAIFGGRRYRPYYRALVGLSRSVFVLFQINLLV